MLATEGVLCADGQAQDRSLLGQGLPLVDKDALWLAERTCCPVDCLGSMAARGGHVVRRQHRQRQGPVVGARPCQGALDTGAVYEQQRRLVNGQGDTVTRRRLTSALPEPTRDGDPEVHGLSHVPERQARAHKLAERDGKRWTMETMLHELTDTLPCEVKAWASPQAAVFGLCLALLADNAVSVLQAALRAIHGRETVQQDVSAYSLALEISQTSDGRMVAIPSPHWTLCRPLRAKQLADVLKALAENVHLRRDKKHPRGPKKPPTKRTAYKNGGHVSTAKVLALRI